MSISSSAYQIPAANTHYSIGNSANYLGTMLTGNGVPNDVIGNFNSLSIILMAPVLNVCARVSFKCY